MWVLAGTEPLETTRQHWRGRDGQCHTPVPSVPLAGLHQGPHPKRSSYRKSGECLPSLGKQGTVPIHRTGPIRAFPAESGQFNPLLVGAYLSLTSKEAAKVSTACLGTQDGLCWG